jgi:hypothetical protein
MFRIYCAFFKKKIFVKKSRRFCCKINEEEDCIPLNTAPESEFTDDGERISVV